MLNQDQHFLQQVAVNTATLIQVTELFNNSQIHIEEASHKVPHCLDHIKIIPDLLQTVEERLTTILTYKGQTLHSAATITHFATRVSKSNGLLAPLT